MKLTTIIICIFILFKANCQTLPVKQIDLGFINPEPNYDITINTIAYDSSFIQEDSLITAYGIVQSTGIREKDNFKVKAKYQLETAKKSFYLLTDSVLDEYWGQCVRIKGVFPPGWDLNTENFEGQWTWGRSAIKVISISLISGEECDKLRKSRPISKHSKFLMTLPYNDSLSGYIYRTTRPSIDIGMDYAIALDNPLNHPEESSIKLTSLPIFANIELEELNKIIEKKLHITTFGWVTGGYAEKVIFKTDSIIINND